MSLVAVVEHIARMESYPDGASQHCVALQCVHKVCIHSLIQYFSKMASMVTGIHEKN